MLFMGTLRLYTKQALPISEQIELLKSRGLNIADSSKAAKFLGEVSYFRFVQYLRPMWRQTRLRINLSLIVDLKMP